MMTTKTVTDNCSTEIKEGGRFAFGKNWRQFLVEVNEERIVEAQKSLSAMLGCSDLRGKKFLDVGSGSGLFSLAARRLGASVHSFDFDPQSVSCTRELRDKFMPNDIEWVIESGSILDKNYLSKIGQFDVVYSWGVLHHTGDMWTAIDNASTLVRQAGLLFIGIYNDQGWISRYWYSIKRVYNKQPFLRPFLIAIHTPYLLWGRWAARLILVKRLERGMSLWWDMIDWIGGYPFEFANTDSMIHHLRKAGFSPEKVKDCGRRLGCNELVMRRG